LSTKIKANEIQWRRSKVIEMRARGMSQAEIARELQVSEASISLDTQYLRTQAKESIKEYATEYLPEQYQVCLTALDEIIKHAFDVIETSDDNREKLQAMELFKDIHLVKLELLSNATTIDSALSYIRTKQQEQQKKHLALDSTDDDDDDDDDSIDDRNGDSQLSKEEGRQTIF
jgi:predicted transcriptional regulator